MLLSACASLTPLRSDSPYKLYSEPTDDHLVVPGKRIGRIYLKMPLKDALKVLGDPSESRQQAAASSYLYQQQGIEQFAIVVDEATQQVIAVRTGTLHQHTPDDVAVGSSQAQVKAILGAPARIVAAGAASSQYCFETGIRVQVEYAEVKALEVVPPDSCR